MCVWWAQQPPTLPAIFDDPKKYLDETITGVIEIKTFIHIKSLLIKPVSFSQGIDARFTQSFHKTT